MRGSFYLLKRLEKVRQEGSPRKPVPGRGREGRRESQGGDGSREPLGWRGQNLDRVE